MQGSFPGPYDRSPDAGKQAFIFQRVAFFHRKLLKTHIMTRFFKQRLAFAQHFFKCFLVPADSHNSCSFLFLQPEDLVLIEPCAVFGRYHKCGGRVLNNGRAFDYVAG